MPTPTLTPTTTPTLPLPYLAARKQPPQRGGGRTQNEAAVAGTRTRWRQEREAAEVAPRPPGCQPHADPHADPHPPSSLPRSKKEAAARARRRQDRDRGGGGRNARPLKSPPAPLAATPTLTPTPTLAPTPTQPSLFLTS
ncbi:uncharacterized protein LOC120887270 [Ictidomys tridecemlineatus]